MGFTSPYVTDAFTAYPAETIVSKLSLAVWLKDGFTQKRPIGKLRVSIMENGKTAFGNLSGYHLFTDLPPGNYTISVSGDAYLSAEATVDTSVLDPRKPVMEITLSPNPAYPFPGNATLVRGVVGNGDPVVGAEVTVAGKPEKTMTDQQGEFVLFFMGIKTEVITLQVKKGGGTETVSATIEEGMTVSVGKIFFQ
jgi:hypothetical protein